MLGVANGGGWNGGAGASEVVGVDGGAGDSHTVRGRKTSRWSCQPKRAGARGDMPGGRFGPKFPMGDKRRKGEFMEMHTTSRRRYSLRAYDS